VFCNVYVYVVVIKENQAKKKVIGYTGLVVGAEVSGVFPLRLPRQGKRQLVSWYS
jgi:hypothetical protein